MNNEKFTEEFNRKNEMFVSDLNNKESFLFSWQAGAVLPISHPKYYDNRINVEIRKVYNNSFGNINFEKDEYQVFDDIANKLYNYIEQNIEKFVKLALNQTTKMYEGVYDNLSIKFKSVYISLSELNTTSEEENIELAKIKNDIRNIICIKKIVNNDLNKNTISDEQIEKTITEIVGTNDKDKNNLLSKLIKKIIDMPVNIETTITQLMQLDNNLVAMVNPLLQGEIFNSLIELCEKLNIKIEINNDEFVGLGYHYKFKKINK